MVYGVGICGNAGASVKKVYKSFLPVSSVR